MKYAFTSYGLLLPYRVRFFSAAALIATAFITPLLAQAAIPIEPDTARPVRGGFHFQIELGWGYGPTSGGLFHNMEIGGTFRKSQITVALDHTFIQSKGYAMPAGGEHLVGGWMLMLKKPVWNNRLVAKGAAGLGGIHDQTDGIKATAGFGISYGLDYDLPLFQSSGVTLSLQCLHAFIPGPKHHFWAALGVGYTFF